MEASLAYSAKKQILSDAEYDELKKKLRKQNSRVVQQARALLAAGCMVVLDSQSVIVLRFRLARAKTQHVPRVEQLYSLRVWCMAPFVDALTRSYDSCVRGGSLI